MSKRDIRFNQAKYSFILVNVLVLITFFEVLDLFFSSYGGLFKINWEIITVRHSPNADYSTIVTDIFRMR